MKHKTIFKKILGYFLILCSVITFAQTITWILDKEDYNKEYVYSDSGNLYYETNDEKIYIEKIYDTNEEILQLSVPNGKTIIMYCYKDKPTEGIYLGINNTSDSRLQYPIVNIYVSAFILVLALFILRKRNNERFIQKFYLFYIFLFTVGIGLASYQGASIINYYIAKAENNIVNATIYSDIYEERNW